MSHKIATDSLNDYYKDHTFIGEDPVDLDEIRDKIADLDDYLLKIPRIVARIKEHIHELKQAEEFTANG